MTKIHISHKTDDYVISRKAKGDYGEYDATTLKIRHERKMRDGEVHKELFEIIPSVKRGSGDKIKLSKKNAERLIEKLSEIMGDEE